MAYSAAAYRRYRKALARHRRRQGAAYLKAVRTAVRGVGGAAAQALAREQIDEYISGDAPLRAFRKRLNPRNRANVEGAVELAEGTFLPDPDDVAGRLSIARSLADAGRRITRIDERARQVITDRIAAGRAAGYSSYDIARGVERDGFQGLRNYVDEFYRGRARTIARTETATVSNNAALDRYQEAGIVECRIFDSPDCGLTEHDDPEKPNGKVYPMDVGRAYPISHPNCVRVVAPNVP
ncbi:MAG: hypothetical protein OXG72_16625 [Acidobacteria bacterium]|nr:hypothetical protein [Acidobacteriota bacterium]